LYNVHEEELILHIAALLSVKGYSIGYLALTSHGSDRAIASSVINARMSISFLMADA
jgi:hypothetical protein